MNMKQFILSGKRARDNATEDVRIHNAPAVNITPFDWGDNGPPPELEPTKKYDLGLIDISGHVGTVTGRMTRHRPFTLVKQPNGDWIEDVRPKFHHQDVSFYQK